MSRSVQVHRKRLTFVANRAWLLIDWHLRDRSYCFTWRWHKLPVIEIQ